MLYSVWNQHEGAYDYYETDERQDRVNSRAPKHLSPREHGVPVAEAAHRLPGSARRVGRGERAVGKIAREGGGPLSLGALDAHPNMRGAVIVAGAAAAGYLAYKVVS